MGKVAREFPRPPLTPPQSPWLYRTPTIDSTPMNAAPDLPHQLRHIASCCQPALPRLAALPVPLRSPPDAPLTAALPEPLQSPTAAPLAAALLGPLRSTPAAPLAAALPGSLQSPLTDPLAAAPPQMLM
ncbi:unnamed protein product [Closterium sp. NIES-53]